MVVHGRSDTPNDSAYKNAYFYPNTALCGQLRCVREPENDKYARSNSRNHAVSALEQETLNKRLLRLIDELSATTAAHNFHYEAIEALMHEHQQIEARALQGLSVTNVWLRERNDHIIAALEDILILLRRKPQATRKKQKRNL